MCNNAVRVFCLIGMQISRPSTSGDEQGACIDQTSKRQVEPADFTKVTTATTADCWRCQTPKVKSWCACVSLLSIHRIHLFIKPVFLPLKCRDIFLVHHHLITIATAVVVSRRLYWVLHIFNLLKKSNNNENIQDEHSHTHTHTCIFKYFILMNAYSEGCAIPSWWDFVSWDFKIYSFVLFSISNFICSA